MNGDLTWGTGSGGAMTATVSAGQTASYLLQIAGWTGATGSISFTCTGAPQYSTCTITPNPATLNGTTAIPVTITVTTQSTTAAIRNTPAPHSHGGLPLATMAGLLGCFAGLRRLKGKRSWAVLASCLALAMAFTLSGCGDGPPATTVGTASGTYALNVTATFGSTAKTLPLTLVIH